MPVLTLLVLVETEPLLMTPREAGLVVEVGEAIPVDVIFWVR